MLGGHVRQRDVVFHTGLEPPIAFQCPCPLVGRQRRSGVVSWCCLFIECSFMIGCRCKNFTENISVSAKIYKSDNSISRSSPMPWPRGPRSFSAELSPVRLPTPPRKLRRNSAVRDYLRPDEVEAMVQAARKTGRHPVRDAAIILMMFRHGLCTAELVALRWHQVELKAGHLDVH